MKWHPTPPWARLPSGTRVEVLWGQPEQKYGVRATERASRARFARAFASRKAMRSRTAGEAWKWAMRGARARATSSGETSGKPGSSTRPDSSFWPMTRGRRPSGSG